MRHENRHGGLAKDSFAVMAAVHAGPDSRRTRYPARAPRERAIFEEHSGLALAERSMQGQTPVFTILYRRMAVVVSLSMHNSEPDVRRPIAPSLDESGGVRRSWKCLLVDTPVRPDPSAAAAVPAGRSATALEALEAGRSYALTEP